MLTECGGGGSDDHVVDGDLPSLGLQETVYTPPSFPQPRHVHVDREEEVGDRPDGFHQPTGNGLPHLAEGDVLEVAFRLWRRDRPGGRGGPDRIGGGGLQDARRLLDVALHDPSTRPRAGHMGEVHAGLPGQTPCQG